MPNNIECTVKIENVPEKVKNGLYGCWIVARYTGSDHKWWYYSVFKEVNKANDVAKEVEGSVFYYKEGEQNE